MSERTIVCFGPGPVFKGGISNYNTSLAKTLSKFPGVNVQIVSWTQQYPAIIPRDFKDKASKKDLLEGTGINVTYLTNYNNPASWKKTCKFIASLKPEMVIFQWAIALQGLPMGWMARWLMKNTSTEVIFDVHLVVQKEASSIDKYFLSYGLKKADSYIVHSLKSAEELQDLYPNDSFVINENGSRTKKTEKTIIKLYHPIYDMFRPDPNFNLEEVKKELNLKKYVFLYFGFIRKYKGLHNLIPAFAKVADKRNDVTLLIVGESFWNTLDSKKWSTKIKKTLFGMAKSIVLRKSSNEEEYNPLELIRTLGLQESCTVINRFVPNEEVNKYFQVADAICNYYEVATPSGVESIAYNFRLPVLATKVGHFPETVKPGINGYLAEADDVNSMAEQMLRFIDNPIDRSKVDETAKAFSWNNYAQAILKK